MCRLREIPHYFVQSSILSPDRIYLLFPGRVNKMESSKWHHCGMASGPFRLTITPAWWGNKEIINLQLWLLAKSETVFLPLKAEIWRFLSMQNSVSDFKSLFFHYKLTFFFYQMYKVSFSGSDSFWVCFLFFIYLSISGEFKNFICIPPPNSNWCKTSPY